MAQEYEIESITQEQSIAQDQSIIQDPVMDQSIVQDQVMDQSIIEDPVMDQSIVQDPVMDQSIIEDPVSITDVSVLVDISGSMTGRIEPLIEKFNTDFLSEFSDNDVKISVRTFNNNECKLIAEGPPSTIRIPELIPQGGTPLYDAIIKTMRTPPKILIIISDGQDTTSRDNHHAAKLAIGDTKVFYIGYMGGSSLRQVSSGIGAAYAQVDNIPQAATLFREISSTVRQISEGNTQAFDEFSVRNVSEESGEYDEMPLPPPQALVRAVSVQMATPMYQ